MHATFTETVESDIWSRLLGPQNTMLPPQAAQAILKIDFSPIDKKRIAVLAAKARKGNLTNQEHHEIDSYGRISSFISIMKSQARAALRNRQRNGSGAGSK